MVRTFAYRFDPPGADPAPGPTLSLELTEIEDAGLREVLQTPGATYGAWSILDALLTPTGPGSPFTFKEPLGQAREVKVALSGLFGRFVARAYLERYFKLSIFAHLGTRVIDLDRRLKVKIKRLSRGDLPDWIACAADLSSLTVAEAKGCHDRTGPSNALGRAWAQAQRINLTVGGRKVTVKRIAVATRWGVASPFPTEPNLSVRDPIDEGVPITLEEEGAIFVGLLRLHIANLIRPLGHPELAGAIQALTLRSSARGGRDDRKRAEALLRSASVSQVDGAPNIGDLIGGIVSRAGPISGYVAPADQGTLTRLNLRPVFVGVEHDLIRMAIDGDASALRSRLDKNVLPTNNARPDHAGGWIVPLRDGRRVVGKSQARLRRK